MKRVVIKRETLSVADTFHVANGQVDASNVSTISVAPGAIDTSIGECSAEPAPPEGLKCIIPSINHSQLITLVPENAKYHYIYLCFKKAFV